MLNNTVIVIVGPTAVGKTKLSIEVAKKLDGEIISGDAMQVYKGLDIGTAKVTRDEMQGIPHHMLDIKAPDEPFSVADFQKTVQAHIQEIQSRNKYPIIVGGSGLYIQATLYDYNFAKQMRDPKYTAKLEDDIERHGIMPLYEKLQAIDPRHAKTIHPNNHRRIIRALEVFELTDKTVTEHQNEQPTESPYDIHLIGLEMERDMLYDRINKRVDMMLDEGLIDEVRKLYDQGFDKCQSMKAIGYKEFVPYFTGDMTLDEAIKLLKRHSRRYAKRQYTWFKNKMDVNWYPVTPGAEDKIFKIILNDLAGIPHH